MSGCLGAIPNTRIPDKERRIQYDFEKTNAIDNCFGNGIDRDVDCRFLRKSYKMTMPKSIMAEISTRVALAVMHLHIEVPRLRMFSHLRTVVIPV